MNIIGFAGSNSSTSINREIVRYTLSLIGSENIQTQLLDLNDFEMPLYSIDREKQNGFPAEIDLFTSFLQQADGIVISLAEHNRSATVAMKNIFDWCSRKNLHFFNHTPVLLLSTSPGAFGGGNALAYGNKVIPNYHGNIVESMSIPKFNENFAEGQLVDNDLKQSLMQKITLFLEYIRQDND